MVNNHDQELAVFSKYIESLTPATPIYPEMQGTLVLFKEIIDLVPVELVRKYATVPLTFINNTLQLRGYSTNLKFISELISILKIKYDFKLVAYDFGYIKDIESFNYFRKNVLIALKKYYAIEYTEEELAAFEAAGVRP